MQKASVLLFVGHREAAGFVSFVLLVGHREAAHFVSFVLFVSFVRRPLPYSS